jgi:hypothetical protein
VEMALKIQEKPVKIVQRTYDGVLPRKTVLPVRVNLQTSQATSVQTIKLEQNSEMKKEMYFTNTLHKSS